MAHLVQMSEQYLALDTTNMDISSVCRNVKNLVLESTTTILLHY